MKGPRHLAPKIALALTASLLLPACAARKPIPSDPPEVRTEAMVRGKGHPAGAKPVEQPAQAAAQALQGPVVETIIAEKKDPQTTDAQIKTAVAKVDARMSEVTADAQMAAKPEPAVVPAAEAKQPEAPAAKAVAADSAVKPAEPRQPEAKQPEAKQTEAKQESATQEGADGKKAEAAPKAEAAQAKDSTKDAAKDPAQTPRVYMVQIASFSTEKNADAALTWLKDKGYSEARVARAEQAQTVYHRVQAGPFQDLAAARKALEELKADWPQAFIPAD